MAKIFIPLTLTILIVGFAVSCSGHKYDSTPSKRSPEELKVNDIAAKMETDIGSLQSSAPPDLQQPVSDLAEAASRFNNNAQRFGPGSLEARNAFDKIRYHTSVINKKLTKDTYPQLIDQWTKIQSEIEEVSKHLGYRGGKYPE